MHHSKLSSVRLFTRQVGRASQRWIRLSATLLAVTAMTACGDDDDPDGSNGVDAGVDAGPGGNNGGSGNQGGSGNNGGSGNEQDASMPMGGMDGGTPLEDGGMVDGGMVDGGELGDGGLDGSMGDAGVEPCELYCDNAMTNCSAGNQLYETAEACMTACAAMPVGESTDTAVNSVYCRAYHADLAVTDPVLHCPHASVNGGNQCGVVCEAYCSQVMTNCTGENELYANNNACFARCALFPNGEYNDESGNTVQCRTHHGALAADDPATHCPHAGPSGGDVCSSSPL